MKWFDNWIVRRAEHILLDKKQKEYAVDRSQYSNNIIKSGGLQVSKEVERNSPNCRESLNFKVYHAVGGRIVEFTRYNDRHDRMDHDLYIIGNDQDFGERIAKIATLEVLK